MKWCSLVLLAFTFANAVNIHTHGHEVPVEVVPSDDATVISFGNGIVFDTRYGDPEIPDKLTCAYDDADYFIVQCSGPIYKAWIEELKYNGLDIMGYIPSYALLVHATPAAINEITAHSYIQWTGAFHPAYKLNEALFDGQGTGRVVIQVFPDQSTEQIASSIRALGFTIDEIIDHELARTIDATIDLARVDEIARIQGVLYIQPWSEPALANDDCQWVVQTGWRSSVPSNPGARQIWYNGVLGQGTVLSSTDTGVRTTHYQFYDASYPINSAGVYPNHRKMVGYKLYGSASFGDVASTGYHGTHVNGTIGGNDTTYGSSNYDGMAKLARLYFVDVCNASGGFTISSNLTTMYDTIYLGRGLGYHILQHSGSWRWYNSSGTYLLQDATTDAYAYANKDFLNLYAAGNEYSAMRIGNPGISKNILTVGATQNSTSSNQIASFSSRGPTQDNRIKPNIMAPGDNIYSAYGGSDNGYQSMSGTSMATPASNGAVGLIRQYLLAGFYPTGLANPGDSIKYQSAALLRTMAMVSCDPNVGSYTIPSFDIGWGRINVDSVCYFDGDTRRLIIVDDTIGVNTGNAITDSFEVHTSIPLRISVAWTDTAASSGANPTLVNDLNIQVTAPGGTYYRGNQYSGGQSQSNPGSWDNRNVEECFRINSPTTGIWTITVTGQNVPYGPQPYAYTITGDVTQVIPGVEEYTGTIVPTTESRCASFVTDGIIHLSVALKQSSQVTARVFDLSGRVVTTLVNERLASGMHDLEGRLQASTGIYFIEVRTDNYRGMHKVLVIE
jgi:subtilisin family serine protease